MATELEILKSQSLTTLLKAEIERMILDGPHGDHYDLLHHTAQPNDNSIDSI